MMTMTMVMMGVWVPGGIFFSPLFSLPALANVGLDGGVVGGMGLLRGGQYFGFPISFLCEGMGVEVGGLRRWTVALI